MYSNPFERLRAITRWSGGDPVGLAIEAAEAFAAMPRDPAGLVVACRRMLAHHPDNAPLWWVCAQVLGAPDAAAGARDAAARLDRDRTAARLAAALPFQTDDAVAAAVGWTAVLDHALEERVDFDVVVVRTDDTTARTLRQRETDRRVRLVDAYELATLDVSLLLVPARAVGPKAAVVDAVVRDAVAELRASTRLWLIGGTGRVLPGRLFDALVAASGATSDPAASFDDEPRPVLMALEAFDRLAGDRGVEPPHEGAQRSDCPVPAELLRPF